MAENYELAYKDYKNGMKQKEIAAKYNVSINTVKSWQQRKWKEMNTDEGAIEKVRTPKSKSMHTKKESANKEKKVVELEEITVNENGGLTDKQWLFCLYYTKYWNATKAYQKAYEVPYNQGRANGARLIANDSIKIEINRMKEDIANGILIDARAVLQKYIDIAFADITDFIDFTQVESEATETEVEYNSDGSKKSEKTEVVPYTYTKFAMHHSEEIDGTLITELSKGKDGMFKVKLADKMAALAFLAKYTDLLNENERKQLHDEKAKVEIAKIRSETKGLNTAQSSGVDLSNLSTEELRALAARNKR